MKKILLSLVAIATISLSYFGQAPEGFKYQAVVRDAGGLILNNQAVGMRLTVQQGSIGGTAVYTETFSTTTNAYGLVNLEIGTGTTTDDFTTIDWSNGPYFMETAVDFLGGMTWVVMGTSQLMSVPYALYAKTSGNGAGPQGPAGPAGADGTNGTDGLAGADGATGPQGPAGPAGADGTNGTDGLAGADGATGPQGPIGNDGPIGATGPQGPIGNDGAVGSQGAQGIQGPAGNDGVGIAQTLSKVGGTITLSDGGGSVNIDDTDATNELQQLTVSTTGDTLHLQNGGYVIIPGISAANASGGGGGTYPTGSVFCNGSPTTIVDVTNPTTGAIWMDRNLGATQAATSSTDVDAYGDLYQWGRSDGHQCRTAASLTSTLSRI